MSLTVYHWPFHRCYWENKLRNSTSYFLMDYFRNYSDSDKKSPKNCFRDTNKRPPRTSLWVVQQIPTNLFMDSGCISYRKFRHKQKLFFKSLQQFLQDAIKTNSWLNRIQYFAEPTLILKWNIIEVNDNMTSFGLESLDTIKFKTEDPDSKKIWEYSAYCLIIFKSFQSSAKISGKAIIN